MNNQFNRYYRIIQTILEIDPKTIYEELVTALRPSTPSYTTVTRWAKCCRVGKKDVNDDPRSASLVSEFTGENIEPLRQVISNNPHSIYDEIIPDTSLSLSWHNRTSYPRLPQDDKSDISMGTPSTNS